MLYRNTFLTIFRLLSVCLMLTSANLKANTTDWIFSSEQPSAKIRLLLSGELDKAENQVIAGLQVVLDSPWKTYWRSPGEAGIPPAFYWQTNHNVVDTQWLWPVPERFDLLGIQTLGYQGSVVFPLLITVNDLNTPVTLDGILRLSSCTTICVLSDFAVQASFIPDQLEPDSEAAFLIDKALSKVPETHSIENPAAKGQIIESVNWRTPDSTVVVSASSPDGWQKPDIILDGLQDISFSKPELRIEGTQLQAIVTASSWLGDIDLNQQSVNVTLINGEQATETAIIISDQPVAMLSSQQSSFMVMVLFALLGGFILNLMPCVLPVLGLKLSSVVQATGQDRKMVRWQFLSSASGILVSFWLLALFLLALKWTGNNLGWGIQFQNPWFIGFMAVVTGLFAANLLEAFEIQLSSSLNTRLATTGNNDLKGHFVQGMFATLLATPCSAPFLGTAVAFALTTDAIHLLAIFSAMGIGAGSTVYSGGRFSCNAVMAAQTWPLDDQTSPDNGRLSDSNNPVAGSSVKRPSGLCRAVCGDVFCDHHFYLPASGTFFQGKAATEGRHQSVGSCADHVCLALGRQSDNALIRGIAFSFRKPGLASTG